ncbi:aldo/keto reductase [Paenibacillus hemerocallicola]|uniref:aldo/keto reductase n=1 Tax=Paenibacillus hemerocallicola TaxID=1172614 RepID=UPI00159ED3FC|nr:aldo/keto reductase [Paenibacillus hemerocallicola]
MKYAAIPYTDLVASPICLGTSPIGSRLKEEESFRLLDLFVELGGNFLDSSHNYADWACEVKSISEKTIGKWMKARGNRSRIIVGTKGACPSGERFFRLTRDEIMHDLHGSLQNLQTDCIDLYWLHRDDPTVPVEQILEILLDAADAGKIRHFACSNWSLPRIREAQSIAAEKGKPGFCASQIMWSLAQPNTDNMSDKTIVVMDEETKRYHAEAGMAQVPFSSQAGGFFGGRYNREDAGEGRKPTSVGKVYFNETNFGRLDRVREVASRLNASPSEVALAYLFAQPFPVFPIIGSHTPEQLTDSCKAGDLRLDERTALYLETGRLE